MAQALTSLSFKGTISTEVLTDTSALIVKYSRGINNICEVALPTLKSIRCLSVMDNRNLIVDSNRMGTAVIMNGSSGMLVWRSGKPARRLPLIYDWTRISDDGNSFLHSGLKTLEQRSINGILIKAIPIGLMGTISRGAQIFDYSLSNGSIYVSNLNGLYIFNDKGGTREFKTTQPLRSFKISRGLVVAVSNSFLKIISMKENSLRDKASIKISRQALLGQSTFDICGNYILTTLDGQSISLLDFSLTTKRRFVIPEKFTVASLSCTKNGTIGLVLLQKTPLTEDEVRLQVLQLR